MILNDDHQSEEKYRSLRSGVLGYKALAAIVLRKLLPGANRPRLAQHVVYQER